MKKIVLSLLFAVLVFAGITVAAESVDDTGTWAYETYGSGVALTEYKGSASDVYVPNKIEAGGTSLSVVKLGDNLFNGAAINSATLGEGITIIGEGAFANNTNIVCIVTPESLTTIGKNAFSGCTNFNSIILYDTVTSIGENAFAGCTGAEIYGADGSYAQKYAANNSLDFKIISESTELITYTVNGVEYHIQNGEAIAISFDKSTTEVTVQPTVNGYPVTELRHTFDGCSSLTSVTLPDSLKTIGASAFTDCKGLKSLTIPNSVTSIGSYAFLRCESLTSITIPNSVTSIGNGAFSNCTSFTRIEIPSNVINIGSSLFWNCTNLASVSISSSVTNIGEYTFYNCKRLANIEIPGRVTSIGDSAFYNCTGLARVSIPNSVTSIGEKAFYNCTSLASVSIPNGVTSIRNSAFYNCTSLASVSIPNSVTSIETSAFSGCKSLTSITIPNSVTSIGDSAFYNCTALASVSIPNGVTSIRNYAFYYCTSLASVSIPNSVMSIGEKAFSGCKSLTSITIPNSVTSIGNSAFSGCAGLTTVVIPESVATINSNSFAENTIWLVYENSYAHTVAMENDLLYFITEEGTTPQIYTVGGIKYFIANGEAIALSFDKSTTIVTIPSVVEGYPVTELRRTFYNCANLTNVTLPDSLKTIENSAFYNCTSLASVSIPNGVTSIGDSAFSYCTSLASVSIPNGVTSIRNSAFYYCTSLKSLTIPNSVTSIEEKAFSECTSLASVSIPNGVTSIGDSAFSYCTSLASVSIPNSVTSIGTSAFSGCKSLKSLTIPNSVTSIGEKAFSECISLTTVAIPESVATIYSDSFVTNVILCVVENSYAHTFAMENDLLYFVTKEGAKPETYTEGGVKYFIANGEAIAISFDGSPTSVIIPSTVKGCPVTELRRTFYDCATLTGVTLPDTLEIIGECAFSNCRRLVNIEIPSSVTSIGDSAFSNCDNIEMLIIPGSVTSIGDSAFWGCEDLSIEIQNGVTSIGDSAFAVCDSLMSVTIPGSVKSIGGYAFYDCLNLGSVEIQNGVTSIGEYAFYRSSLKRVTIPSSVTSIGRGAFDSCYLTSIEIQNGVTSIGDYAFSGGCGSITSLTIPSSVTSIGYGAFAGCYNLTSIEIPNSITSISDYTFYDCSSLTSLTIPNSVTSIGDYAFYDCSSLTSLTMSNNVTSIGEGAFSNSVGVTRVVIPKSVETIYVDSFATNTILCVYENSYAHTFAVENDLLYFVIHQTLNPEISYGQGLSGTVTNSNGNTISGASVTLTDDSGVVRETVTTDETGAYEFTYAEVGRYTIRATDALGAVGTETVSVKRMNVFEVYLTGETDIVIDSANAISGTVSENNATITITDEDGNVIASYTTTDGTFKFDNITNGTYIIKAETQTGSAAQEITVFNGNVTDITLPIVAESSGISGTVKDEDGNLRVWAEVTVYNSDGIAVASGKTNENGVYTFSGLANDEYAIVAQSNEIKKHHKKDYDRAVTLKGYGFIEIAEVGTYTVDIVVSDENEDTSKVSIAGKVTAEGERNKSTVVLYDVFRNEVAKTETGSNGKYKFVNVKDGLYFVTATTESDGMGITVVVVRGGKVYGTTDIRVFKSDKIKNREEYAKNNIPECGSREDALKHRDKIREEKEWYDKLSKKEKQQLSKEYIDRLEQYIEWISQTEYKTDENVKVEGGGSISSGEEIYNGDRVQIEITIEKTTGTEIGEDGVKTHGEYERQTIEDNAKEKEIKQYYNISMRKGVNGEYHEVDNIHKDTDTTGKLRITMPIPEEYKGYKHYTFVHMHNGEAVTLVDLDDDPDTITFEVDKFSTFVLCASNEEVAEIDTYAAVTISGENAVTSVDDATVTIGETTGFKVTPKLGYYIASITIGEEPFTGFDAYKGGTYTTGIIEKDTVIVVTTAAITEDASGTYSTDVATLPAVFAEAGTAVTFGKVLDANATSYGVELTKGGQPVLTYHGDGPLYKANAKTADGQYAVEFIGLKPGTYTVRTYIIVNGAKTFGAPTNFTVE